MNKVDFNKLTYKVMQHLTHQCKSFSNDYSESYESDANDIDFTAEDFDSENDPILCDVVPFLFETFVSAINELGDINTKFMNNEELNDRDIATLKKWEEAVESWKTED